jgi:5'(3')-deoxyribonucleotidase
VCADYTSAFRSVVAGERGIDAGDLGENRGWDFAEWQLSDLGGFDAVHRRAVLEHRMFRTMPAMPRASEVLWRLSDAGVWIRIITHRLYVNWGHAIAVSDTVEWLDNNAIPYRDICFLGRKPEVEADCYVDDSPDVVAALRNEGNAVIVFDAPYNAHLDEPRAKTWVEVEHLVGTFVADSGIALQATLPGFDDGIDRLRSRLR